MYQADAMDLIALPDALVDDTSRHLWEPAPAQALREGEEITVTAPAAHEPVSFAQHIKPLFRATDRESMAFAFDLWDVDDVRSNAEAILGRLRQGTMPCHGGWSSDTIELFGRWIAAGKLD
jgi:hypothetical protein